ncbi:hypothetical protein KI387_012845 [Taxus chinensis]|uniref:Uncharacterized protein n=1 Tax=Taxus chinensis TaxID=29808 RepID=A0AA38CJM0_TAXCH|nr:hypothetical protein KI387_012845 [Taxus chinensis]
MNHAILSLEDYANIHAYVLHLKNSSTPYTSTQLSRVLNMNNLSQALKIHGFSPSHLTKEDLLKGLAHMEMFDPCRSSVDLGNLECDLSTEEMERDMDVLGWLECPSKSVNGVMTFPLLHQSPQSSMSAPSSVYTEVAGSGANMACLGQIYAIEGCKQPIPLKSVTAPCTQDLLKCAMQMTNLAGGNPCEKEGVIITQNCGVLCESKNDGGNTVASL